MMKEVDSEAFLMVANTFHRAPRDSALDFILACAAEGCLVRSDGCSPPSQLLSFPLKSQDLSFSFSRFSVILLQRVSLAYAGDSLPTSPFFLFPPPGLGDLPGEDFCGGPSWVCLAGVPP